MISFDDQPYSDYLCTPLTTIRQQCSEMGEIAIKLLINEIESERHYSTERVILPTKLIIRESVKKLERKPYYDIGGIATV